MTSKTTRYKFDVFKTTQTTKTIHGASSECVGNVKKSYPKLGAYTTSKKKL